jgi:hypothetical protein
MPNHDATDYPYLRAWAQSTGSFPYYVGGQLALTRQDRAPATAAVLGGRSPQMASTSRATGTTAFACSRPAPSRPAAWSR